MGERYIMFASKEGGIIDFCGGYGDFGYLEQKVDRMLVDGWKSVVIYDTLSRKVALFDYAEGAED